MTHIASSLNPTERPPQNAHTMWGKLRGAASLPRAFFIHGPAENSLGGHGAAGGKPLTMAMPPRPNSHEDWLARNAQPILGAIAQLLTIGLAILMVMNVVVHGPDIYQAFFGK